MSEPGAAEWRPVDELPRAFGLPACRGVIRAVPEDFEVEEILGFEPEGEGEHALLWVEKRGANTRWVAHRLAEYAGLRVREVGYSGLKDRHAVARQWFSLRLAGRPEPDWMALQSDEFRILRAVRHRRKLRPGTARGNRFRIVVRDLGGDVAELERRLSLIAVRGVPNYFGEQRFGNAGGNLERARALLAGESGRMDAQRRGIYLSTARSLLFNQVLAERVADGSWDQALPGEVLMLDGSHSVFVTEVIDETLQRRLREQDLHPTGPLWGNGGKRPSGVALSREQEALRGFAFWREGLERLDMAAARRALRLPVQELNWRVGGDGSLVLSFTLPRGSYATAVLHEGLNFSSALAAEE